jgi:hypothetical protein
VGVKKVAKDLKDDQVKGAPRAVLEDLFEDYYKHRRELYFMNLIRGVFFGFGSVIGGTLVVALLLWLLSALQYVPFLDGIVNAAQESLESRPTK